VSNYVLLSNEVGLFFFLEILLFAILLFASFFSMIFLKNWDFSKTTGYQYGLEKRSYLINTIIYFTLIVKLFLMGFFIYTVDSLSNIIPGAMCAAGVFNANGYGYILLCIKVIVLFLSFLWLSVNSLDLKAKNFPYFQIKTVVFLIIVLFAMGEMTLNILFFTNLSTESLATCCSVLYDTSKTSPIPFSLSIQNLIILFYLLYFGSVVFNYKKYLWLGSFTNIVLGYIGYYALIYFFGTYVYELPTHNCPFCMMQKEYTFIGYFIFISLFFALFFTFANLFFQIFLQRTQKDYFLYSSIAYGIFVFICTIYVVLYYLKNGVFL
jgi:hypothetical protein